MAFIHESWPYSVTEMNEKKTVFKKYQTTVRDERQASLPDKTIVYTGWTFADDPEAESPPFRAWYSNWCDREDCKNLSDWRDKKHSHVSYPPGTEIEVSLQIDTYQRQDGSPGTSYLIRRWYEPIERSTETTAVETPVAPAEPQTPPVKATESTKSAPKPVSAPKSPWGAKDASILSQVLFKAITDRLCNDEDMRTTKKEMYDQLQQAWLLMAQKLARGEAPLLSEAQMTESVFLMQEPEGMPEPDYDESNSEGDHVEQIEW